MTSKNKNAHFEKYRPSEVIRDELDRKKWELQEVDGKNLISGTRILILLNKQTQVS